MAQVIILLACASHLRAQPTAAPRDDNGIWSVVDQLPNDRAASAVGIRARKFKSFQLNHGQLQKLLASAPNERAQAVRTSPAVIALPMPDGSFARFRFVEAPVMEPALAAKFPELKTFRGHGIDDPQASVRFDITPAGFHAQILSPNGAVYVDPAFRGENGLHTSYFKRDYVRAEDFRCWLDENAATAGRGTEDATALSSVAPLDLERSGANLRTYRVAVAATGEYTAFHGGTLGAGMAAIVTAINRVTGVYETEVAIRLVLIANNDLIVYTNSSTDPYSNNNPSSLLTQNQANLDSIIGSGNYDIGHVFSTAGGGLAGLGVVCISGQKARGETGTSTPIGDAFYIDYVAHEMGHQFGANHTFNSSTSNCGGGNRNASTAYEPGSGSTIMAYAGICGSDDLQPHSDPYFHSISFDEILNYTTLGSGNSCAALSATGNTAPIVSAGGNYTIPQSTPFMLTASGTDSNGDPLTYCWEERDLGASTTVAAPDNGSSPIFRSWNPTTNTTRFFPRLEFLLNNTLPIGEVMPTTLRTMNFRVTARDNRAGGGGVNTADMQVSVTTASGPFVVTSHNNGGIFFGIQSVTWNVAGTTNSPVNCANVDILLSTNGGQAFPITLAANVPNTGSQTVVFPNLSSSTARLMVRGSGNIFFDVCNSNFTVISAVPTPFISLSNATLVAESCVTTNNAIDPDEIVTVDFALRNTGSGDTTNLVATLLLTNGVVSASSSQNYGALVAGGAAVTRPFSLIATGMCGTAFTATLQLQDGAVNLGTVSRTFNLGALIANTTRRTNATAISIPSNGTRGAASPYPSTISVSGVTGTVSKVTVTFSGVAHSWPADIDALLVGPSGQTVLLMSDVGYGNSISGVNLTFDDEAASNLPESGMITSGNFKPTNSQSGDTFSSPAPGGSYGATLSVFNGTNPNGTWSLFVMDDSSQDTGGMAQGWQISITTSNSTCCSAPTPIADLTMGATVLPTLINLSSNAMFTFSITNLGPDTANSAMFTNTLPAGLTCVSAIASVGTCTNDSTNIVCQFGPMTNGATAIVSITVAAQTAGAKTNIAGAFSSTVDPDSTNNAASAILTVNAPPFISSIGDLITNEDFAIGPIEFTIGDLETSADLLMLSAASSDTNLVPQANITFGGNGTNRTISIAPATNAFGAATITVSVSDGFASAVTMFSLTVDPVNDPPQLAMIPDFVVVEDETLNFTNGASDIETPADLLSFSVIVGPTNVMLNPTNGVLTWTTSETDGPSTNNICIVVTDDGAPNLSATQCFSVVVLETNSAPMLAPISDVEIFEGTTLTFTNFVTDLDIPVNSLLFAMENAPTNAALDTNGVFSWTPSEEQGPGSNYITIIVTDDGTPSLSATQNFSVVVLETNEAPVLGPIADVAIYEETLLTFTNVATDSDTPPNELSFSFAASPTNAVLDATNGVFAWTPTEAEGPSTNLIGIVVTDSGTPNLSVTQWFSVVVLEFNSPPVLAPIADQKIHAGRTLILTNSAIDSDLPTNTLTFALEPGAPDAASINPSTGVFSWTPTDDDAETVHGITVRVSDDGDPVSFDTKTFLVTVVSRPLITSVEVSNEVATVTWTSLVGQTYRLQYLTNLNSSEWIDVAPDVNAIGPAASQTDAFNPAAERYYRIKLVP